MAVIAAVELHDPVAAGRCARQSHRGHRGLRPARDEPDELNPGSASTMRPASSTSPSVGAPKVVPLAAAAHAAADDLGWACPNSSAPHEPHQVDVPVAVDVDHVRALAAIEEPRVPPTAPNARTGELTPPGITVPRADEQFLRPGHGPMLRKRCR